MARAGAWGGTGLTMIGLPELQLHRKCKCACVLLDWVDFAYDGFASANPLDALLR